MKAAPWRFLAPALLAAIMQLGLPVLVAAHAQSHEQEAHHGEHRDSEPESTRCPVCHLLAGARNVEPATPTMIVGGELTPQGQSLPADAAVVLWSPVSTSHPRAPPAA